MYVDPPFHNFLFEWTDIKFSQILQKSIDTFFFYYFIGNLKITNYLYHILYNLKGKCAFSKCSH